MPFVDPSQLPEKMPGEGWHGRFFHSEHMTFGYYEIDAGAAVHEHFHENEEVWHVLDGEMEITIGRETEFVGAGRAAIVPADTPHSARAVTACQVIVVDQPVRATLAGISLVD